MAEAIKRVDLNKEATVHATGSRILNNGGVRALVTSDLPASEVIGTLSKRVRENKHRPEKYSYLAPRLFGKNMVFDGTLDITYQEYKTQESRSGYAAVVLEDFNSTDNGAVRFTYEAKTESNQSTRILNDVLLNFKTNPSDAVANIFKETENVNKKQAVNWANQVWTELAARTVEVDVTGMPAVATEGDSISKTIFTTLLNYGKNSKTHLGVGTDPVAAPGVIADDKGNSVSPTMKFDSSEFYLLTTPAFQGDVEFDGNRVLFNWGGRSLPLAGQYSLFIDDEEMLGTDAATAWENAPAVLIHKDAVYGIQDWEGTGFANAGKLYQVFQNYMKQDAVPVFDAPVVAFVATPEVVPAPEAKEVKEAK